MLPFKRRLMAGLVKPTRSKAYLEYVKSLNCCGCGVKADEAHHLIAAGLGGGMGTKASDFPYVIPLCRKCHNELHLNVKEWEEKNNSQAFLALLTVHQAFEEGVISL